MKNIMKIEDWLKKQHIKFDEAELAFILLGYTWFCLGIGVFIGWAAWG